MITTDIQKIKIKYANTQSGRIIARPWFGDVPTRIIQEPEINKFCIKI